MDREPSLLVELLRRHPVGPILYLVGFAALGVLWLNFEPGVPTNSVVKIIGLVGIVALAIGMPLTHKHAFRIQAERMARRSARTPAPWDAKS